jgi:uncharacterized iron-regulated protein
MRRRAFFLLLPLLSGCALPPAGDSVPDAWLLGEQHDVTTHQLAHLHTIESLAARGELAAVVIEMAESGHSTAGLAPGASEADVRTALAWHDDEWPWKSYGPAVMAAVRAGVPVLGANLPRSDLRAAMKNTALDSALSPDGLQIQRDAVREGHCGLLPESEIPGMARVQIARDRAMAQAVRSSAVPGRTVVLLAGGRHVDEDWGVPKHLAGTGLRVRVTVWPGEPPARDECAALRERLRGKP